MTSDEALVELATVLAYAWERPTYHFVEWAHLGEDVRNRWRAKYRPLLTYPEVPEAIAALLSAVRREQREEDATLVESYAEGQNEPPFSDLLKCADAIRSAGRE
jgi:hypothetical protein